MSWIVYASLANILFGFTVIFDKFVNAKKIKNVYSFGIVLNTVYFIFILITTYFLRGTFVFGPSALYSILAGIIWFFMWIFFWKALQQGEASRVSAIFFTQPIYSALIGISFLHESLSHLKWIGIIVIVIGAILSSMGGDSNKKEVRIAYVYALLAALFSSIGNSVSKYAMNGLPPLTVNCIAFYATIPLYLFILKDKAIRKEVFSSLTDVKLMVQFGVRGLLGYGGIMMNMTAFGLGPISLITAILGTQPMVILLISLIAMLVFPKIIHEELGRKALFPKVAALLLTVLGVVMISV